MSTFTDELARIIDQSIHDADATRSDWLRAIAQSFGSEAAQHSPQVRPATPEVIIVRDPDGGTDVTVFLDGRQVETVEHLIDPGAGHTYEEWVTTRDESLARASSDEVRQVLREAFDNPPGGSDFIEGFPD